jgi:hypothetical protein
MGALVVLIGSTVVALATTFVGWTHIVSLAIATAAFVALLVVQRRTLALNRWLVVAASAGLLVTACAFPPRQSADVWAYAMYGRVDAVHHADPYVVPPITFRDDPFLPLMGKHWWTSRSLYGPAFTAISGEVVRLTDDSPLRARAGFQALAALAVLGCVALLLVARPRDPMAAAFVGLNPFVIVAVVNGAHNDALVGFFALAAALLAARRMDVPAGAAAGLGALMKIVGVIPMGIVALWTWRKRGLRAGAVQLVTGLVVVAVGYAVAGTAAVRALADAFHLGDGFSVWKLPLHAARLADWHQPSSLVDHLTNAYRVEGLWAAPVFAVLAIVFAWPWLRDHTAAPAAGAAVLAYALATAYVLPWFVFPAVALLALRRRTLPAWAAVALSTVLMFGNVFVQHFRHVPKNGIPAEWTELAVNVVEMVLIVGMLAWSIRAIVTASRP